MTRAAQRVRRRVAALAWAALGPASLHAQPAGATPDDAAGRVTRTINRDWTFNYFPAPQLDTAPGMLAYDDRRWPAVAVPHTWSTFETTRELHPFIQAAAERDDPYWWHGWGWYRKRFVPGPELVGRRVFAEFDGVQKYSRVYLNGRFVGEHKGGYTSFSFDLTPYVRPGAENVLAVAVSNRRDDHFGGIAPMTAGNFNVYGGIYRDVRLVVKDPIHIPFQGSADHEGGTFVTTPEVSRERGVVRVRTFVRNATPVPQAVALRSTILDPDGRVVARMDTTREVAAGAIEAFEQTSPAIPAPRLWSPETPDLYEVRSEVRSGGRLRDTYASPLGFRWFRWDTAGNALYLNGRPVHIHGTNRHQEYPWLGDAVPKWVHTDDLRQIRTAMGMNFLRATHYPNDTLVYGLTDRLGIIVVEEVPNIKNIDFGEAVQEQNAREMVRRDRNHPSILFWSLGNETNDPASGRWVWEEDSTRIIHLRHGPEGDRYVQHTDENLELENQLRVTVRGWHDDQVKDGHPENGQHAGTEEWQHERMRTHENRRARIDGDVVHWLYADHGADREYVNAPLKHVNPKGWVDLYRVPKYAYHLWRANWSDSTTLFVHPHLWRRERVGSRHDIIVDANTDYVELKVNGRSLGRRVPDRSTFFTVTFRDVTIEPGVLSAEGMRGGLLVRDSVVMAGPPARLVLSASHDEITADRAGISVVTADVLDARGVRVQGANPPLTWRVSGPATLVGPERYESDRDRREEMTGTMYVELPVKNVVRSTATPGEVVVTVSSPGLAPAVVRVRSVSPREEQTAAIRELAVADAGRGAVTRDTTYVARPGGRTESLRATREPLRAVGATGARARARVRAFVLQNNPKVDTTTAPFRVLVTQLAGALERGGGVLIEDDFNVLAARFNTALDLVQWLGSTGLHPLYRAAAAEFYAQEIVARGASRDLASEQRLLAPVLRGARLAIASDSAAGPTVEYDQVGEVYRVRTRELTTLVGAVDPTFTTLPAARQARALRLIDAVNPHVRCAGAAGAVPRCELDVRRPILVPARDVLTRRNPP